MNKKKNQITMVQTFSLLVGSGVAMTFATQDMGIGIGISVAIFGTAMIAQALRKTHQKRGSSS